MFKPNRKILVDAVIFDLDGTIIDSIGIYYKIVEAVLERLGLPQVSTSDVRNATKDGGFEWSMTFPFVKFVPLRSFLPIGNTFISRREIYDGFLG